MAKAVKARRLRTSAVEQTIAFEDLTGGQNLRLSPTLVGPTQARELRNVSLNVPGELPVRPGFLQHSLTSLGNTRAQGGARVYLSSATFTLLAHNSSVYLHSAGGADVSVLSGLSTNQVYFPHDRQMVAVLDGLNRPKKSTNGSSWTNFGIDAPPSAPSLSSLSSGGMTAGTYEFAYTYKQRSLTYESNGSTATSIDIAGSTAAVKVTAIASTEAHVDAYVFYARKPSAGETIFRKVSSGAASTTRIVSTSWTSNDEIPTNHNVLAAGKFGVIWKNRWWVVSPSVNNRLFFSEIFLPQAFPVLYYIDIPFERGDSITAVTPLGDTLIVWGQSKAFLVIGQTSLDFEVRPSAGVIAGALGPRAVATVEQGIIHASAEGVHIFDGASDKLISLDIEPAWRDLVSHGVSADLDKIAMVYEFRRKCLRVAVPRVFPRDAPGEWELNLDRTRQGGNPAWCNTDRDIGGYLQFDGNEPTVGDRGELLSWNSTSGMLTKESTGTTANGANMSAEYEGPTPSFGLTRSRVVGLHVEYEPHGGNFTTETAVDGISQGGISLAIGAGLSMYGASVYGTATYGGSGRRKAYTPQPLSAEGKSATLKWTYTGQEAFRVFTYAYDIVPETRPRLFSE